MRSTYLKLTLSLLSVFATGVYTQAALADALVITVDRTDDALIGAATCDDATPNDCSLRGAISLANSDGTNSYTINLPSAEYQITRTGSEEDLNDTGDLDILRSVSLIGASASSRAIINANHIDRAFDIFSSTNVTFQNIEITGGRVRDQFINSGGCIYNSGTLSLSNIALFQCEASRSNSGGVPAGGALFNEGSLTITNSSLASNSATYSDDAGYGGFGGALYFSSSSSANISHSSFFSNTCGENGASSCKGGALYSLGTATIENCSFVQNTAYGSSSFPSMGGAAYVADGAFTIRNVTFGQNTAQGEVSVGGAIATNGSAVLNGYNNTFAENQASQPSTLIAYSSSSMTLNNTIIKGDGISGPCGGDASIVSSGGNFEVDTMSCGFTQASDRNKIGADELKLGDLLYDGKFYFYPLLEGSSAIGAAFNTGDSIPATDQRSYSRDSYPDSGAYEYGAGQTELSIISRASADSVTAGDDLGYRSTITNLGSSTTTSIHFQQVFNLGVSISSATSVAGVCNVANSTVTCSWPYLEVGAEKSVAVVLTTIQDGTLTSGVTVSSAETDISPGNNSENTNTIVLPAPTPTATPTAPPTPSPTATPTDTTKPRVRAQNVSGKAGRSIALKYRLSDNSGTTKESIKITRSTRIVKRISVTYTAIPSSGKRQVNWNSRGAKKGTYRFCVTATDRARNSSTPSCANIKLT